MNTIRPQVNGPLEIAGEFELIASDGAAPQKLDKAWMCRCGQSGNKPLCDGSHNRTGFVDKALVVADYQIKRRQPQVPGTRVRLTVRAQGPISCLGSVKIVGENATHWIGDQANLCRCGNSGIKPFCDGSHRKAGFEAP